MLQAGAAARGCACVCTGVRLLVQGCVQGLSGAPLIPILPPQKVLLQEPQEQLWVVGTNATWMVGEETSLHPLRAQ